MPSIQEGLSILALEASFNGLPVMINHCAGLYDTLPDNWPLSVRDNNMTEWLHLFNDVLPSANRASLARQARSFVEQRFSLTTMQTEYVKLYTT
jgi:glycosyltransferase involved in cell wall biosynthesis